MNTCCFLDCLHDALINLANKRFVNLNLDDLGGVKQNLDKVQ